MEPPHRTSRISGARRRAPRSHVVWAVSAVVACAVVLIVVTGERREHDVTRVGASPSPSSDVDLAEQPTPSPAPPTPPPSPTPRTVTGSVWVDLAATPRPFEPTPADEGRVRPTPSPAPIRCVWVRSARARPGPGAGHVVVEVEIENGCGRDLGSLEAWVWVGGYRQGELVQSARGHPFGKMREGRDARVTIGLPGSASWYDRIEVRTLPVDGDVR